MKEMKEMILRIAKHVGDDEKKHMLINQLLDIGAMLKAGQYSPKDLYFWSLVHDIPGNVLWPNLKATEANSKRTRLLDVKKPD